MDFPRELPKAILAATRYWSLVDRRDFFTSASLAMTGWVTPLRRWLTSPAAPQAAHAGTLRHVGATDVAELLSAAEDARRWDSRYGGGNWRSSAMLDCLREQAAPLLHGRYTDRTGRQLFSATAQLARLAAWTAFDAGQHATAQRHYIQARRLARAGADIPLGGYVVVCAALQASLRGFHDDAIDMCQGAYERAKHAAERFRRDSQPGGDAGDGRDVAELPLTAFNARDPVLVQSQYFAELLLGQLGGAPDGPEQVTEIVGCECSPNWFSGEKLGFPQPLSEVRVA